MERLPRPVENAPPEGNLSAFEDLCRLAAAVYQAPRAVLRFGDGGGPLPGFRVSVGEPLAGEKAFLVDFEAEVLATGTLLERSGEGVFAIGIPVGESEPAHGVFAVLDHQPLPEPDPEIFGILAREVIAILEHQRSAARLAEKNRLAELRASIGIRLASGKPLPEVLRESAEDLAAHYPQSAVRIWTVHEHGTRFDLEAEAGEIAGGGGPLRLPSGEGRLGEAARGAFRLDPLPPEPDPSDPACPGPGPWRAFTGSPLQVGEELLGILTLHSRRSFSPLVLKDLRTVSYLIAQKIEHERAERSLERRERVARFLAQASAELAEVGDYESTMQKIANSAVPDFSDWCAIYLMEEEDRQLKAVAIAHLDPQRIEEARALTQRLSLRLPDLSEVMRTGHSELVENFPDERLRRISVTGEDLALLRRFGFRSSINVPLLKRGGIFGLMTFYTAESGRRFDLHDLYTAEDLARRAAVAIENASLYQQLQDADRQKDEFLAMLAHELRNPLAPLFNAVELLRAEPSSLAPETLEMMVRQLRQMVRLIDDLFDISRIKHNRMRLRRGVHDLCAIVRNAAESCRPQLEEAAHRFHLDLAQEPIWVDGDAARLAQVVANLVNNAVKYTPKGGEIALSARCEKNECVISVRDNGIGIDEGALRHIFDLFSQVRDSLENSQGGMGIGLTLVLRLVELHGGSVEAHSEGPGRGSEFVVRLPLAAPPENVEPPAPAPREEPAPAPCRVLIVDDNRDAAHTLARLLQRQGYELRTAYDGPEAIDAAREFRPRIILLDIGLPSLSGYEVARIILKESGESEEPPPVLIAMTGWGQENDRRRSREAGFTRHLIKPVDLAELRETLREFAV